MNCVLALEIKLANVPQDNHYKKNRWGNSLITNKALEQIGHYQKLLSSEGAGEWLKEKLDLDEVPVDFKFTEFIVADNFFYDHQGYRFGDAPKEKVGIVSVFELEMILHGHDLLKPGTESWARNELFRIKKFSKTCLPEEFAAYMQGTATIHRNLPDHEEKFQAMVTFIKENQIKIHDKTDGISLPRLVLALRKNVVWSFLDPLLKDAKISKKFKMLIGPEFRMVV
jgi:hypothetical protein